ncbi:unnamed protein product [Sphagnum jensenii]|uniref:Uncharacterized protein n=1 Tax=Sphagnum jensenii TaxID=128206 RepID=A0ABP0WQQ8_9BRYO
MSRPLLSSNRSTFKQLRVSHDSHAPVQLAQAPEPRFILMRYGVLYPGERTKLHGSDQYGTGQGSRQRQKTNSCD